MSSCHAAAVILAAGASTRLGGSPKVLLPFAGRTIVETVTAKAREAGLDPLIVVVGPDGGVVRDALVRSQSAPDRVILNPDSARGIAGSVASGVGAAMTEGVDAAAVLLADEPGVEVAAIGRVVEVWCRSRPPAVRAMYADRPGHPVVFARSVFALVAELPPAVGVLAELKRAGHDVGAVTVAADAPIDVDTPDDYQRALKRSLRVPSVPVEMTPGAGAPRESPHQ